MCRGLCCYHMVLIRADGIGRPWLNRVSEVFLITASEEDKPFLNQRVRAIFSTSRCPRLKEWSMKRCNLKGNPRTSGVNCVPSEILRVCIYLVNELAF